MYRVFFIEVSSIEAKKKTPKKTNKKTKTVETKNVSFEEIFSLY